MKRMLRITCSKTIINLTLLCTLVIPFTVFSQQAKSALISEHPIAVVVSTDAVKNNITVDLTGMPDFFDRAFLLDLLFSDPMLVVNNSSIAGPSLELFSDRLNDTSQVLKSLETYYNKALSAGKTLSENQKKELMKKYEKYR
jgi:hypothetical protein